MTFDSAFHGLSMIFQVFLLDLILSGDNAVVIALSCRSLPPRQLNQALLIGTGAAIGLRVLLTTVVSVLLKVPMLKLIGAVLLIVIGIRLLIEEERGARAAQQDSSGLWSAVMTVIVADVVMSLDNVVALSAVTQGDILYLTIGLILSVLLLMFSSKLMIDLLHRYPILIQAAGALLGYIAGGIAVSDPAVADWVNTQSPALTGLVPLLCAVFVVAESRIIQRRRCELPRPAAREGAPMRCRRCRRRPSSRRQHPSVASTRSAAGARHTPTGARRLATGRRRHRSGGQRAPSSSRGSPRLDGGAPGATAKCPIRKSLRHFAADSKPAASGNRQHDARAVLHRVSAESAGYPDSDRHHRAHAVQDFLKPGRPGEITSGNARPNRPRRARG